MDLNSEKEWMRAVYHSEAERNACTYCKGVFPINFCSNTIFGVIANLLDPDTYPLKISDYECPGDLKPPQVFSKDFWFSLCLPLVIQNLDTELVELNSVYANEFYTVLSLLIELIDDMSISRERMTDYMKTLTKMLKCCECYEKEVNRRKAQKAFLQLINKFDPTSQFLLLSRLIELAIKREIIFSTTLHEPQIIAWIVDQFRRKTFSITENEECRRIFCNNLTRLYNQIEGLAYDDMAEGLEFYRSVLLFMYSHAASRISLQTLSTAKDTFLNKYVNQIGDYKRIIELKKKNGEDLNAEAETRMLFLNESLRSTNDYLNKALAE